jgi:putative ABC transport system permease protein|tara:strand:- start:554 stop:3049 length:2496 start_codon:yes stop_codon:yes gene_type:complete
MPFLLKFAWQDLRGSGHFLWVLCACLVLGVTLVAATGGLYQQIHEGLQSDSRKLAGGDLQVDVREKLPADAIAWMQARGQVSLLIELNTMMGTANDEFELVEVQSVDEFYPLYGELTLSPPMPLARATELRGDRFGVAIDPVLAKRLKLEPGDLVDIGELVFEVRAVIRAQPDRSLTANWRGSPVMISEDALVATELLQPNSRIDYEYRIRTTMNPDDWQSEFFTTFPGTDWEVSTFLDRSDRIGERLAQAGSALLIVGFSTLFIGGLGVFNSVQAYLQAKLGTIATLRSIGLRDRALARVYLLQVLIMSGLSCALGGLLGFGLSFAGAMFTATQVQVNTALTSALLPSLLAAVFGLLTAVTFAAPAIGRALSVDPAVLFRSLDGVETGTPRGWWLATLAGAMLVILLVLFVLPDLVFALSFVGTVLGLLLMLEGIVRLIRHAALAMDNRRHFALHLALANMHRHGSALRVSLLTLGSALTLLVACTVLITSLLDTIAGTIPEESPDLVLYDIAPYQQKEVEQILVAAGASRIDMAPLVQGRIAALNGRSATMESSLEEQRESRDEHKLTYRADNLDGVTMVRGNWWPSDIVDDRAYVVMEDREADQIGLNVGDILTFNIEGRELEAQLTGIYQQQGLQTRFWFEAILSDGVLDPFISRYVAASYLPGDSAIAAQSEIASTAPSVVSVRTATIVATAKDLLGKAVVGLAMVSGVAFSVSLLVLTGVMASHRSRQVYYSTILHTIGARLSVIRLSLGMEYLLLALVTSVFALVLGILIALPMLHFQLRLPLTFPVWPPVIAAFGVSSVCLYGGASYLMRRLKLQPASLLRGH